MIDLKHFIFCLCSYGLTVLLFVLFKKFVKSEDGKERVLKISAILTLLLHYSILYYNYFTNNGNASIDNTMILPVYPCNLAMWLLVIVAFWKNKSGKLFNFLAEITFYLGTIGGSVGLLFNWNYIDNPDFRNWDILKGLISHSTLIFGCLYIFYGDYIKIRVKNMVNVIGGLLLMLVDGIAIIGLYRIFKMDPPNCMFLLENPFPQLEWFNVFVIGIIAIILVFAFTVIYEQIKLEKEERWYRKLSVYFEKKEHKEGC